MRIGIDIRAAVDEPAGIGKLVSNLVKEFPSLSEDDEILLYGDKPFDLQPSGVRWSKVILPARRGAAGMFLWHIRAVLHARFVARVDRLVAVATLQSAVLAGRMVLLIIPDLTSVLFPELHVTKAHFMGRLLMRRALRRAWRVVAISEHTRQDILAYAGPALRRNHVRVAHIACEPAFARRMTGEQLALLRGRLGLPGKYLLFVGTLEPRKNIAALIRAFSCVAARIPDHELVIAGRKGWKWQPIFDAAEASPARDRIRFLDFVPADDLPGLYQGADVMVYPSLYEGFGIPPLEAMLSGVPVVASNTSSIPEVTGDAALLVDPADEGGIADGILAAVLDTNLRAELIRKGLQRAGLFSWARFASEIASILRDDE